MGAAGWPVRTGPGQPAWSAWARSSGCSPTDTLEFLRRLCRLIVTSEIMVRRGGSRHRTHAAHRKSPDMEGPETYPRWSNHCGAITLEHSLRFGAGTGDCFGSDSVVALSRSDDHESSNNGLDRSCLQYEDSTEIVKRHHTRSAGHTPARPESVRPSRQTFTIGALQVYPFSVVTPEQC